MPLRQPITEQEFVQDVVDHFDGAIETLAGILYDPQGKRVNVRFLTRQDDNGRKFMARIQCLGPNTFLTSSQLRSLCRQLGLDPGLYGIDIDQDSLN